MILVSENYGFLEVCGKMRKETFSEFQTFLTKQLHINEVRYVTTQKHRLCLHAIVCLSMCGIRERSIGS